MEWSQQLMGQADCQLVMVGRGYNREKKLWLKPACQFLVPSTHSATAEHFTTAALSRNMSMETFSSVKSRGVHLS